MGGRSDLGYGPVAQRRPRILVVEDEPRIRALICLYLGRAGFDLVEADDGRAALDASTPIHRTSSSSTCSCPG